MSRLFRSPFKVFMLALAFTGLSSVASAASIPVGFVVWDVPAPGSSGEFDIVNFTGPNSLKPDFPIDTSVNLGSLSLTVTFVGGGTTVFGSSYFTLDPGDGLSFDGAAIAIGGTNPLPTMAVLTGTFSPTSISVSGSGGSLDGSHTILSGFSATILPDPGNTTLLDGDFAIINATDGRDTGGAVPEPGSLVLLGTGVLGLIGTQRRRIAALVRR